MGDSIVKTNARLRKERDDARRHKDAAYALGRRDGARAVELAIRLRRELLHQQTVVLDIGREDAVYAICEDAARAVRGQ